jgi:hypothetical protein
MPNRFGIPADVEERLRARDTRCVYCAKRFSRRSRKDWPTIEHLSEKPPFYWHHGLKEEGLAICCWSCNSSRGNKSLGDWFRTSYCLDRTNPIGENTVAATVRAFLRSGPSNPLMQPTG